jgi:hypothetical protein
VPNVKPYENTTRYQDETCSARSWHRNWQVAVTLESLTFNCVDSLSLELLDLETATTYRDEMKSRTLH